MGIFDKRIAVKPYEYPEVLDFMRAIRHAPWFIDEFKESLVRDVNDFHNTLNDNEKQVIKRTLLCISQIEVSVKTFWAKVGEHLPKPEIFMTGFTFAHNEVVHMEAYSELLSRLGLEKEFNRILEIGPIKDRVDYLTKYLKGASDNSKENYVFTLLLFAIFIESISLFSQFYIVKSFCQKKQLLKTIDNIIMATAKEEDIHFQFGAFLINLIKKEYPEWFNEEFKEKILRACKKAFDAELKIIDWIFEDLELDFLPKEEVISFIKDRFNQSIVQIGINPIYEIDKEELKSLKWFEYERILDVRPDFFDIQSPNYTSGDQEITVETLF